MKRAHIESNDVGLQDPVSVLLEPGISADDFAVVTEDTMNSKAIQEYARDLAFMEEKVTFSIAHSDSPNAIDPVECGVQGVKMQFKRGQHYTVARMFINALINICFNVETLNKKDPQTGLDITEVIRKPYQAYPISIHSDPSPYGMKWFEFRLNGDRHVKRS